MPEVRQDGSEDSANSADLFSAISGLFWTIVSVYYAWRLTAWFCRSFCSWLGPCCPCFRCCCCPKRQPEAAGDAAGNAAPGAAAAAAPRTVHLDTPVGSEEVPFEVLKQRKELCTAYSLLCSTGLFGFHHFYLERYVHGFFCLWSLNFLLLGWLFDLLLLPWYVNSANRCCSPAALSDGSCRRLCTRLPVASILLVVVSIVLFVGTPPALQATHLVDMEKTAAGTKINPYTIIGVERHCNMPTADAAAQRVLKETTQKCPKGPKLDKECRERLNELKRAHEFVSGRAWRESWDKDDKAKKKGPKEKKTPKYPPMVFPAGSYVDLAFYSAFLWKANFNALQQAVVDGFDNIQRKGLKEVGKEFVKSHFPRFYEWANSTREEAPSSSAFDDEL